MTVRDERQPYAWAAIRSRGETLPERDCRVSWYWRSIVRVLERPLRKHRHLARSPLAVIVQESFDPFVDILAPYNTLCAVQDKWHGFTVLQGGRLIERQFHG